MSNPEKPAGISFSRGGDIVDRPKNVIAVVVTDTDDNPDGILEKWSDDAWMYATADSLREL